MESEAHTQDCNCVDWHPTQKNILASASDDGTIRIWEFNQIDDWEKWMSILSVDYCLLILKIKFLIYLRASMFLNLKEESII